MEDIEVPYFFTNKDWYYYDDEEEIYKLTDEATEEAITSYEDYYKITDEEEE